MQERLNQAVLDIEMSGIRAYTTLANEEPGCIGLSIGEPDFNTPEVIKEVAKADLDANMTHYPPGNGEDFLRKAIAEFEQNRNGYDYTPDEVIVTVGATGALFCSLTGILNPGDEVIVPTPAFGFYESCVKMNRGVYVPLPVEKNNFQITREMLEAVASERTKAILLTSPNNPTGCVLNKESLDAIHDFVASRPIFALCDDVYSQLVYTENYKSLVSYRDLREKLILINSFSKPYAMTGWRVGYLCADAPIRNHLQKCNQYSVVSVNAFIQNACVKALSTDSTPMREVYRRRRDLVCSRLAEMGVDVVVPEGAFYVFPSIEKFGMDSDTFCRRMIKEGKVGAVPGWCFSTEGYIRISYCYSDEILTECMDRMEKFIKSL